MIVRDTTQLHGTEKQVFNERWHSTRLLLASDGMGFSFHITVLEAGSEHVFEYKHHFESVYCIRGEGTIEDLKTNKVYPIRPGVMYALDQHDRHRLSAHSELEMACCFNPPVTGTEIHREDGSYAPASDLST